MLPIRVGRSPGPHWMPEVLGASVVSLFQLSFSSGTHCKALLTSAKQELAAQRGSDPTALTSGPVSALETASAVFTSGSLRAQCKEAAY